MSKAHDIFKAEFSMPTLNRAFRDAEDLENELKRAAATANNLTNELDEAMAETDDMELNIEIDEVYDQAMEVADLISEAQDLMRSIRATMR